MATLLNNIKKEAICACNWGLGVNSAHKAIISQLHQEVVGSNPQTGHHVCVSGEGGVAECPPSGLRPHLDVQRGEVAVQLLGVVDVGLAAHGTHHVADVFVPDGHGEVLTETLVADGALAGGQRLHLQRAHKSKQLNHRTAASFTGNCS